MLWGQLYGQVLKNKHFDKLGIVADEDANGRFDDKVMDTYLSTQAKAGDKFSGRFYPTSFQWGGWNQPTAVGNTEMRLWERPEGSPRITPSSTAIQKLSTTLLILLEKPASSRT